MQRAHLQLDWMRQYFALHCAVRTLSATPQTNPATVRGNGSEILSNHCDCVILSGTVYYIEPCVCGDLSRFGAITDVRS